MAFAWFVPGNLAALLNASSLTARNTPPINGRSLLGLVLYELLVGSLLAAFLRARGWSLARLGMTPAWRDPLTGLVLALAAYGAAALLWLLVLSGWPHIGQLAAATRLVGQDIGWGGVVSVTVVNPVFEEVFECAFVIAALRERFGTTTAINVSAAIRVFLHLYQGVVGVLGVVPISLLFAYWFARTGRLWPLIVAHAALDWLALSAYVG